MSGGFERTLQTAADAEGIAALLRRAAQSGRRLAPMDQQRLETLAERYTDYATALRDTAADGADSGPGPDQVSLFSERAA